MDALIKLAILAAIRTFLNFFLQKELEHVEKRLKNAETVLIPAVLAKMEEAGRQMVGKNYDWAFGWSDSRIYCSELVWKIYQRGAGIELAPTKKLREFDLSHPVVRAKMKERYGKKIPLDEPVVAPSQLFESPQLVLVHES